METESSIPSTWNLSHHRTKRNHAHPRAPVQAGEEHKIILMHFGSFYIPGGYTSAAVNCFNFHAFLRAIPAGLNTRAPNIYSKTFHDPTLDVCTHCWHDHALLAARYVCHCLDRTPTPPGSSTSRRAASKVQQIDWPSRTSDEKRDQCVASFVATKHPKGIHSHTQWFLEQPHELVGVSSTAGLELRGAFMAYKLWSLGGLIHPFEARLPFHF